VGKSLFARVRNACNITFKKELAFEVGIPNTFID
jgi:hypothetical protein